MLAGSTRATLSEMWTHDFKSVGDNVLWLPCHWLKREKKFTFLKHSFFWKHVVTVNFKELSSNTIFRWYTFEKFFMVKFNYFSRRLLLIDHYVDCGLTTMRMISEIKTLLVRIKKILVSVSPTLYYANQFTQNGMCIIPWFI